MALLSFVLRATTGAAAAAAAAFLAAMAARRIGLLDYPGNRKSHPFPVPLAGGVGVAAGVTVSLADSFSEAGSVIAAIWMLLVVGLIDDARDLRARTRLAAQAAASLPVLLAAAPFLGLERPLEVGLALLFTLGVISSMNCIDCADGVAASVTIAAALALAGMSGGDPSSLGLAAALAGAAAGFLLLNAPPARVFLGEGGSTILGFLLALCVLSIIRKAPAGETGAALVAAPLALAIPIADFILVHARRVRGGLRSLSDLMASAGTDHLPHRLRGAGLGPWGIVAVCAGATLAAGLAGWAAMTAGAPGVLAATASVGVVLAGLEAGIRRSRSGQGNLQRLIRPAKTASRKSPI